MLICSLCFAGHNYTDIPNHIPKSVGITSAGMLAFFLFWLIHMPFTFFRPYQLRKFFWAKAIVMLPAIWGLFIYCMVETKGNIGLGHLNNTSSAKTNGWGWFFGKLTDTSSAPLQCNH
jgi:nucleobase:cation symporter-1, NCS1 family